ncbi:MAG: beta-ketoacyl synthase chain length factor [Usitatibacter sp.]
MRLAARVAGVGLVGPGLASWAEARKLLADSSAYEPTATVIPSPDVLPAVERRRAGKCVRLALAAGLAAASDAGRDAKELAAIFTSSTGDGENLHAICEALASDDRLISPTRFHNSVHNAPAGYWGIATGAMHPSDCVAAYDASFAAGLLEAVGRVCADPAVDALLISYDAPYPEPLYSTRPVTGSFSVSLVLGADEGAKPGRAIAITTTPDSPTRMDDARLEAVRVGIPAGRSLPLLALLAGAQPGRVVLEYLDGLSLAVDV